METSLRYGGDAKALKIHAKEKLPLDSKTHLQIHGELDTRLGVPTFGRAVVRRFYPDFSASLGVGLQYDRREKLRYTVRAKKSFPVTTDGLLSFNVKGRCDLDKEFKERSSTGAAEFSWSILNFQRDQDVRLKLGYDLLDKVPYMQIRENNWTLNADGNGKWNVRYRCTDRLAQMAMAMAITGLNLVIELTKELDDNGLLG
ncbi:PREDICTED: outer envelope pore protein 21B, chloroplastic-like isoform X2 [Prunus mume]|uniref:Outer envelope pore protein 21B, chloroplastic-like isoform X2 n=1 Tax=Prunus mume TaxID=102107 RepID=A0ABM0PD87_PRUMU|nr:PREDICTED: outer envelope pore protein 21B, chloroplastic-like isoform X2 [Prunus mume]